jgi:hypothetical protein
LFTQEAKQDLIDRIDDNVSSNTNFNNFMSATPLNLGEPLDLSERIQENLSYDQAITVNIMAATEEYNIAVTKHIARSILTRLPLELRNHVYHFLSPDQITVCGLQQAAC